VKGHDGTLAQAISAVDKVIREVNTQAKLVEREIHAACEKLREMVNEREAQLLRGRDREIREGEGTGEPEAPP